MAVDDDDGDGDDDDNDDDPAAPRVRVGLGVGFGGNKLRAYNSAKITAPSSRTTTRSSCTSYRCCISDKLEYASLEPASGPRATNDPW